MASIMSIGAVDATKRAVRTGQQGGVAWGLMELLEAYEAYEFTERQWAITLLVGTAVVSYIQNVIENRIGRGFLKNVPQEPIAAIADPPPADPAIDLGEPAPAPAPVKKAAKRVAKAAKKQA